MSAQRGDLVLAERVLGNTATKLIQIFFGRREISGFLEIIIFRLV